MKKFLVINTINNTEELVCHINAQQMSIYAHSDFLTSDLQQWLQNCDHGDILKLHDHTIVCINFQNSNITDMRYELSSATN
jgi:hypothetical protein